MGNREEQVFGGEQREKKEAREKELATAAPQRASFVTGRKTALFPVLSKQDCGCLQRSVLS